MKNKLMKIYNIFKQIENMKGSTGWDQTEVFYYFYEKPEENYLACWQLLYGLFCENKNLKPSVFGLTLMELRKYSEGFSNIYEFGNSEFPILIVTFDRNGKHQISGTVKVEETSVSEEKEIMFVDGINVDSDIQSYNDKLSDEQNTYTSSKLPKSPELIAWEITYLKNENSNLALQWCQSLGGNIEWLKQLRALLYVKGVDYKFFETYLINIDNLTSKEIEDLDYVEDRIDAHLEDNDSNDNSIFNPETMVTEFIDLTDSEAESRVYESKDVSYHDNNDDLITINTPEQLEAFIGLYGKNSNRLFFFTENKMFRINGEIPESLESLEEVKLFLDYLYDDCNLVGAFHPDDNLSNYTDEHGDEIFNQQQQEKYSKYLDDMFELDADGNSVFVEAGYEDVYDYCMNYRNDNHGINEVYPIKLNYGCTYVRRDGIISGILDPVDGESSTNKNDMIFHDTENDLSYNINGRLIGGEYNSKNAEDLISEN